MAEVKAGHLLYTIIDLEGKVRHERYAEYDGLVSGIRVFAAIQEGEWDIMLVRRAPSGHDPAGN